MSALPLLVTYEARPAVVKAMASDLGLSQEESKEAVQLLGKGLPPLTRTDWLPFIFGVSPKIVGAMSARSEPYYRRFSLKKKSGGHREIVTPRRFLKTIQRWLLEHVVRGMPVSDAAHGFVRGRGIFSNAQEHVGGKNVLCVDVENFFPSITEKAVRNALTQALPYKDEVVSQLSGLMTLDGALPQGAPTSPALANTVFFEIDEALKALSLEWECTYSRYADDLTFSGERRFSPADIEVLALLLGRYDFQLNQQKSRILGGGNATTGSWCSCQFLLPAAAGGTAPMARDVPPGVPAPSGIR